MLRITCRLTGNDVVQDLSTRACFIRVVRNILFFMVRKLIRT